MQLNINKKLVITLALSLILLLSLFAFRASYTKKPVWDAVFEKSAPAIELEQASMSAQTCKADEGSEVCDETRRAMLNKEMDAEFYNVGYEHCLKRFGKSAEECKALVNTVQNTSELNPPSKRE